MSKKRNEIGMILAPTFRSRAYIQMLATRGIQPNSILILPGDEPEWDGAEEIDFQTLGFKFFPGKTMLDTIKTNSWAFGHLENPDVNSNDAIDAIDALNCNTVVYSGFSKILLEAKILNLPTRFLHVHGGYLPQFKGSTAFYYSLLKDGSLGASAIWLDQGIDTGAILYRKSYSPIPGIEIDRIFDPVIRADVLANVFSYKLAKNEYPPLQENENGQTYFVIHPVLKNLALSSLEP
jgi:methionyl-tRNA formyltransferase